MPRVGRGLGEIALLVVLCGAVTTWAQDDEADTEAPVDEVVGKCVTACESEHDTCVAGTKARTADCARQKYTCDTGCSMCTRMYGPQVVYCVEDCEACKAKLTSSGCAGGKPAGDDCESALEACLKRCGP